MRSNIFAYTDVSGISYPGYVSINRTESGDVEVTVREAPTVNRDVYGHDIREGRTAAYVIPAEEWAKLRNNA
jgi:hypothetical protein